MPTKKLTYQEQLEKAWEKAKKEKNKEAMLYYAQAMNVTIACTSFESFRNSRAYENWKKKYFPNS